MYLIFFSSLPVLYGWWNSQYALWKPNICIQFSVVISVCCIYKPNSNRNVNSTVQNLFSCFLYTTIVGGIGDQEMNKCHRNKKKQHLVIIKCICPPREKLKSSWKVYKMWFFIADAQVLCSQRIYWLSTWKISGALESECQQDIFQTFVYY